MVASIIFPALIPMGVSGYQPAGALFLDGSADYLSKTFSGAGSKQDFTISFWIKLIDPDLGSTSYILSAGDGTGNEEFAVAWLDSEILRIFSVSSGSTYQNFDYRTSQVFRDPTAWQNWVISFDHNNGTAGDRIRLWINGSEVADADFGTSTDPVDGETAYWTDAVAHNIGRTVQGSNYAPMMLADFISLDGTSVTNADNFGELSDGIWVAKDPSTISSFGTNGFWLDFSNGSDIGNDVSGNNNDFTPSSGVGANSIVVDGPANSDTKEITLHACLDPNHNGAYPCVISNNNLTYDWDGTGYTNSAACNIGVSSGKYYWEVRLNNNPPTAHNINTYIGIALSTDSTVRNSDNSNYAGNTADSYAYIVGGTGIGGSQGNKRHNGTPESYNDGTSTAGDIIGVAYDATNRALWFSKNNSWIDGDGSDDSDDVKTEIQNGTTDSAAYDSSDIPAGTYHPIFTIGANDHDCTVRFSSSDWSYSPPSGFGELTNTVTGIGNAATLNALAPSSGTLSNGNLSTSLANYNSFATGTIPMTSGKWYWEANRNASGSQVMMGIADPRVVRGTDPWGSAYIWAMKDDNNGDLRHNNTNYGSGQGWNGTVYSNASDVVSVAYDADNAALYFAVNGTWVNGTHSSASVPTSGSSKTGAFTTNLVSGNAYIPFFGSQVNATRGWDVNFGQTPFTYSMPSGYTKLSTQNIAEPTITDPSAYFQTQIWTGSGGARSITFDGNSDMQPDMVWIKKRNSIANSALYDVIRGANKELRTTANDAEADVTSGGETGVTGFDPDGFTIGDRGEINGNTHTIVAWCWKAGGSASTVTDGMTQISDTSVNSNISRSVNTTSKFSIFTYTGTGNASKIQHGLGVTPDMFWIKCRDSTQGWHVWHKDMDTTNKGYIILNSSQKYETFTDFRVWGSNSFPDDTHVMIGTHVGTNKLNDDYVGYAWAGVEGYSKFSTYEGNGTTDNAFINLGFKPSLFICKNIDSGVDGTGSATNWLIFDSIRNPTNDGTANFLKADDSAVESQFNVDFVANGVKIRADNQSLAASYTYIYMAWAESPFSENNRAR